MGERVSSGFSVGCLCVVLALSCKGDDQPLVGGTRAAVSVADASVVDAPAVDVSLCPSGSNIIMGTSASEYLEGTMGDDCILGLGGDDTLYGKGGNDVILGGPGDDYIEGEGGADLLYGGAGNDVLDGGAGDDSLWGEMGDDQLLGRAGVDVLDGGVGNDLLIGAGGDTLLGGDDCDVLDGSDGDNHLEGGTGSDVLQGGYAPTLADGGDGNDYIATCLSDPSTIVQGGAGTDECHGAGCEITPPSGCDPWSTESCSAGKERVAGICVAVDRCMGGGGSAVDAGVVDAGVVDASAIDAGVVDTSLCLSGSNIIIGTSASEFLEGTPGDDCIIGLGGDDTLYGLGGNDVILGGSGNDYLHGGDGADTLYGGDGNDDLDSGDGDDHLYGEAGDDHLSGRGGIDTLDGGPGNDWLGGEGGDTLLGGDDCDTLDGRDGENFLDGGAGSDVLAGGYAPTQALAGPGDDYIATCLLDGVGIVDGGPGTDQCDGADCEVAPPLGCDPWHSGSCPAGQERIVGICVPIDRCDPDSCTTSSPLDDSNCDGIDNNCNGLVDENFAGADTNCGIGACVAQGTISCVAGSQQDSCTPGTASPNDATCNGIDDDCDGTIGEDFVGQSTNCGIGTCAQTGLTTCTAGQVVDSCIATPPSGTDDNCDGLDNDCDGLVDEDFIGQPTTCGQGQCTAQGITLCVAGAIVDSCVAGTPGADDATCDDFDNDCNGLIDEDYVPTATSCGIGACENAGATSCVAGIETDSCLAGIPAASDSTCDGIDDDCDGLIDEDYAPTSQTCGEGLCQASGVSTCVAGIETDTCESGTPMADDATCDGLDDDCDGLIDEDAPSSATSCGEGECAKTGTRSCMDGRYFDSCRPGLAATIDDSDNGLDDDCDGEVDDDVCVPTTCEDVGAMCGRISSCGQQVMCGRCPNDQNICGTDYICTSEMTVRAGVDRETLWGEPLLFGRDKWEFQVGGANQSVWTDVDCEWDFGDGSASIMVTGCQSFNRLRPSHVYASPGLYTVTVTATGVATNIAGLVATDTLSVNVLPRPSALVIGKPTAAAVPGQFLVPVSLLDAHDGTGSLAAEEVQLTHLSSSVDMTTDTEGLASTEFSLPVGQETTITGAFDGNTLYLPSQGEADFFVESDDVAVPIGEPTIGSEGRHFVLAFPENSTNDDLNAPYHDNRQKQQGLYLHLSSRVATTATITAAGVGFERIVPLAPGLVMTVKLPEELRTGQTPSVGGISNSGLIQNRTIEVHAEAPIAVHALDQIYASTDGYLGLPVEELGTEYMVLAYPNEKISALGQSGGTQILVAATADNTVLTITPSVDISPGTDLPAGLPANQPSQVTLQRGQTLLLANQGSGTSAPAVWEDLSGTSIVSTEKVAVFAGHDCAFINVKHCDHLVEQLPPVTALGRRFLTVPLGSRYSGDVFRVVATVDATVVRIDGEHLATLGRGEVKYFEGLQEDYRVVEATKPVLLAQYAKGKLYVSNFGGGEPADPFMALVPPQGQYASSYRLSTPPVLKALEKSQNHYLSLMVRADAARGVRINGNEIRASWRPIGNSGWVGASLRIPDGALHVDHLRGDEPIGLMAYGFANFDSYGFVGGWRFGERSCERTRAVAGDGIDNDCDGRSDEEQSDGIDNDGDGFIDEDNEESASPPTNLAPVADPAYFAFQRPHAASEHGKLRRFSLPGFDPNDDAMTFEIVNAPSAGEAEVVGRILEYVPPSTFFATTVSLTVRAFDGELYSEPAQVTIDIHDKPFGFCGTVTQCANRRPVVSWGPVQIIRLEDGETEREISGKPIAFDVNRDTLHFEIDESRPHPETLVVDPTTGEWSVTVTRADVGGGVIAYLKANEPLFPDIAGAQTNLANVYTDDSDGLPIFISSPVTSVFAGASYSYAAQAIDPEEQPLTYALTSAPIWLNIDPTTGLVFADVLPSEVGTHAISISATDIAGGVTSQDYVLTVYRFGPTLVSTPLTIATEERPYRYQPVAVHDGSALPLTWELALAAPGMSIDAASGEVQWTPAAGTVGAHTVRVEVVDTAGLRDGQTFTVLVNDQSSAPTIESTAPLRVHVDDYYLYQVEASDPDAGDVLSFSLTEAPVGMSIGQGTGLIQWLPGAPSAGLHSVEVTVYDAALNTDVQQFVLEVEPDYVAPSIVLSAAPPSLAIGETTTLRVELQGNYDASTLTVEVDGVALALDAELKAIYTATSSGAHFALATVTDESGNGGSSSIAIAVTDASDTTGPVADLTVADDTVFTYLHDVAGTASDANLLHYTLALRPTAEIEFSELYRGYANVTDGTLANIDTTLLENGYYELRLLVTDINGLTASDSRRVRIDGAAKVGLVQLSFVDMAIEMAGLPLTVVRSYDSRVKRRGDFGVGWDLDIRAGRVSHSRPIGEGFAVYTGTDFLELPCLRQFEQDSHFTEVRLSATEWYLFKPVAVGMAGISGTCAGQIIFEQVDGTREAELVILGDNSFFARPQTPTNFTGSLIYGQLTDGETGTRNFDPQDVRLSTADGRTLDLNTRRGVFYIEDANGNSVAYERDFITHSDGRSIDIQRDQSGRITTITDPIGNTVQYQYDSAGDLVGVIDLLGTFTEFLYQAPIAHHLTDIIDPQGNHVAALDYTSDGRLAASCDANDDCTRMTYDLLAQSQTTEDATRVQTSHTYDTYGNITSSTDGLGNTTSYEGGLYPTAITDPLGNTTRYTYAFGKVLSRTDPHAVGDDPADHTVSYEYGPFPRSKLIAETNKAGATIYRDRDGGGNVLVIRDDAGNVIQSMTRTIWGKLLSKTDRFGTKTYEHTSGVSQPTRVVDGHGVETIYAYDDSNRLLRMVRAGLTAQFTYDSSGRETHRDYGNGVTVNFGYSVGVPEWTRITGPTFGTITRKFSSTGRLVEWTKANGDTFAREFDGAGRIATETDALGNRTLYQYDGAGRLESTTREADGASTSYTRDAAGNVLTTTSTNGDTFSNVWESGQVSSTMDARGFTSSTENTPVSISATDALGRVTTVNLSTHGLLESMTLPGGQTSGAATFLGTTKEGQAEAYPTTIRDAAGRSQQYSYAQSELLSTTVAGSEDAWIYQFEDAPQGRIVFDIQSGEVSLLSQRQGLVPHHLKSGGGVVRQSTTPGKIDEEDTRDWPRRLQSVTSPLGDTDSFSYNAQGLLSSRTYPSGASETITYGTNGRPSVHTRADSSQFTYEYNSAGQESMRTTSSGETRTLVYGPGSRIESATDDDGTTRHMYDTLGRLSRVEGARGGAVEYTYTNSGVSEVSVEVGSATRVSSYEHDASGNLARLTDPLGGVTTFVHDAVGRMTGRTLPNGITSTWTYDLNDQVTGLEHRSATGDVLVGRAYTRAITGEPTRVASATGESLEIGYDGGLRITSEEFFDSANASVASIVYSYDLDGRRTSRTAGPAVEEYVYTPGSMLERIDVAGSTTDQFAHDPNGRTTGIDRDGQTLSLGFGVDDGVTSITDGAGVVASYAFDALGGRDYVEHGGVTRRFLVAPNPASGMRSNHAVMDAQAGLLATYVYAGEHPLMKIDAAGQVTYYLQDPQGTTLGLADDSGNLVAEFEYDSFGTLRSASGVASSLPTDSLGDYRFQGMWLDASGLYHVRARTYDPATARFLSRDAAPGDIAAPATLRPYAFVGNNPWIGRDPTGRTSIANVSISVGMSNILASLPSVGGATLAGAAAIACAVVWVSAINGAGPCNADLVTVHKGVNHAKGPYFYGLAKLGIAVARGGDYRTPTQHNLSPGGPWVSVTTNVAWAERFALNVNGETGPLDPPGVIISARVSKHRLVSSPDTLQESEKLLLGILLGTVERVEHAYHSYQL